MLIYLAIFECLHLGSLAASFALNVSGSHMIQLWLPFQNHSAVPPADSGSEQIADYVCWLMKKRSVDN